MALTTEQIVSAVDTLRQRGQTPTLRAIRELLGHGSLGTISRILRSLKETRPDEPGRPSLPSALLKALEDAFLDQARALQQERERESLEERRMIETLEEENRRLESQILELEASLRKKTEEEQRGEGRIAEIRRTCESLERLLERERAERLRAEKQASVLEGERNGLREQIADLRERLTTTFPGRPRTNKSPSSGKPSPTRIKRRTEGPDPGNP